MAEVLIVDDERAIREGMKMTLSSEGFAVRTARDGGDALKKIGEHKPDLVLLDVMMPRMNGFAACGSIRKEDKLLPVIFLTAKDYYRLDKTEFALPSPLDDDYTLAAGDLPKAEYLCAVVTVGNPEHMTAAWTSGDGAETNAVVNGTFEVLKGTAGVKVIFMHTQCFEFDGDSVVELGAVTEDLAFGDGNDYAVPTAVFVTGDIVYLDWDEAGRKMTNATLTVDEDMLITSKTRKLEGGKWYVVADKIVIDNGDNITVNGSANLVLMDGASLMVTNVANKMAAIEVAGNGSVTNRLAIYGQENGSGLLSVTGGDFGAGIGGGWEGAGGSVTINGGVVTAQGGFSGADIGGGQEGAGGEVTINGGSVTANGGNNGAGIGGGDHGVGGTITINGGTVTATGGGDGAGIGGGGSWIMDDKPGADAGRITVNGGVVTAFGGDGGAGIGGGAFGKGAHLTVNGGTVFAYGGYDAKDIGGGAIGEGGVTVVNGGSMMANSVEAEPVNAAETKLYRVYAVSENFIPTNDVPLTVVGLGGYGTADVFADEDGAVCFYLPNGHYEFTIDGWKCVADVQDGTASAEIGKVVPETDPFDASDDLRILKFEPDVNGLHEITFVYVGGHVYGVAVTPSLVKPSWAKAAVKQEPNGTPGERVLPPPNVENGVGVTTIYVVPTEGAKQEFFKLEPR